MGWVFWTWTEKVVLAPPPVAGTGTKPELNWPDGVQPWVGFPAVTVWFWSWKTYCTVSPTAALTLVGEKVSCLLPPTLTLWVAAKMGAVWRRTAVMVLVVKCILMDW